jgi:hypothetical protein
MQGNQQLWRGHGRSLLGETGSRQRRRRLSVNRLCRNGLSGSGRGRADGNTHCSKHGYRGSDHIAPRSETARRAMRRTVGINLPVRQPA